jgi:uncharacterized repeat protein (TIGR01451 family)
MQHRFHPRTIRALLGVLLAAAAAPLAWAATSFTVVKATSVVSDPVNGTFNPKAIPGGVIQYVAVITNSGTTGADSDTFVFTNPIPSHLSLCVGDIAGAGSGPVAFIDGSPSSDVSYAFVGLAAGGDDLDFSNDGGASWTYVPTPDGNGCDASVTNIRVALKGAFAGASGGLNPSCTLQFRCRVK